VTVAGGQEVTFGPDSDWIRIAYLTLAPLLGTVAASTLFAVALLASGQSRHHHRHTGRTGGDGRVHELAHPPWIRRMISRTLAVVPAIWIISIRGQWQRDGSGQSQSGYSLPHPAVRDVPAAAFHLLRRIMGRWANGWF